MSKVKRTAGRRRSTSKISAKNQITLPIAALDQAGLAKGDRVVIRVEGPGRILIEHSDNPVEELAGSLTGMYETNELDTLRDEWR